MADVTNSTIGAGFLPQIWANMALEVLRANIVLAPLVTKDSDVATFQVGNTLHIPYPGTFAANTKAVNAGVTLQTPTSTDTTVTLSSHKESSFLIEDFTRAQANPILMQSYITAATVALVEQVETDLIGTYSSFSGSVGTSGTDLTAAAVRTASKVLTDKKVPIGNRHLLISTKDRIALQADSSLQTYWAYAENQGVASTEVPDLYGFHIHESQLVPAVAGTPVSTKNLAFDPGAIILASRALPEAPANSGVAQHVVQDPVSGLVLRVTLGYDKSLLGVQCTLDVLYGVAKLRDEKGLVVLA